MNDFGYTQALNLSNALEAKSASASCYIAGGTNLLDLWKYNLTSFTELIDVHRLPYDQITEAADGSVTIGAMMTNAATAYHPLIESRYPLLSKAILAGASAQIRNMATNGGNLLQRTRCYYFYDAASPCNKRVPGSGCPAITGYNRMHAILGTSDACIAVFPSDMCVALGALDATVLVTGPEGDRAIAFQDFHRLPGDTPQFDNTLRDGELITGIRLPARGFAEHYSYLKLRDRSSYAFALVSVATALELDGTTIRTARIALGGVAHKPWHLTAAEELLVGKPATEASFSAAADVLLEGATGFGHNDFKRTLARRAIVRNGLMALHPETQLPGAQPSR